MTDRNKLTAKQAKILSYIERQLSRTGRPPTYRDIAEHCGYAAVGTVQDHIQSLLKKGFLERDEGVARGLRLSYRAQAVDVPVLGSVPAGRPVEALADFQGSLSVALNAAPGQQLFALQVRGDSMTGAGILDGDFVIVSRTREAKSGDIVVALIDGEATVKTLEKKSGRARLLPANPSYEPIEIPSHADRGDVIQGRVVALQRSY